MKKPTDEMVERGAEVYWSRLTEDGLQAGPLPEQADSVIELVREDARAILERALNLLPDCGTLLRLILDDCLRAVRNEEADLSVRAFALTVGRNVVTFDPELADEGEKKLLTGPIRFE